MLDPGPRHIKFDWPPSSPHGHPHLAFGRYTNPSATASRTSPAACCTTDGLNYAVFNGTSWTPANQREILTGSLFGGPYLVLNKQGHAHLLVDASPGIDPNPLELTNAAGGGFTKTKLANTQFQSQSLALTAAGKPVVLLLRCCSSATEGLHRDRAGGHADGSPCGGAQSTPHRPSQDRALGDHMEGRTNG